jgi:transposase
MRTKVETDWEEAEKRVRDIRRATRRQYSAEEKIRIVIAGVRRQNLLDKLSAETREG